MTNTLIADVASYQPGSLAFFRKLKKNGVQAVMVKLTDNTDYLNELAGSQVTNAFKSGMKTVGLYHYFHGNPVAEAKYFLKWVHAFGMDKDTPLAIDVEDKSLPDKNTHLINVFTGILKANGYTCRVIYGSASWFNAGRIKYQLLSDKNIWVASYGSSMPGVDHANAWQYTDNFKGMHVDASLDFDGTLAGTRKFKKPASNYIGTGTKFQVITDHVSVYNSLKFDNSTNTGYLYAKGSVIPGTPVKLGSIYRIKLDDGKYISANKAYIKKV